ncbi:odorant receptor 4-like isoform X2 [Nomia melanderi]|uniref:odorant receptor 4-like isoform X2 n=1 Tax=Nomia melanderi TaxID=2448451 RepID=UPI003FCEB38A
MDYERDLKEAIGWNIFNLNAIGIWPDPMTLHDRLADFRAFASMIIILTFINIWQTWNLFMSDRDLIRITETLSLANIPAYNAAIKLGVIWYYKKDLQPIVQSLYDDWYAPKTNEERTTMMNSARFSKRLSFWCIVLSLIMLTTYVSLRSFKIVKYDVNAMSQDRLAIYPAYYPFDLRRTSVRVVANVAQVIAAYCGALPYSGVDTFIATLVMHACGQFKNLCRKLERLMDETSKKRKSSEIQQELAWIIKRHEHLNWIGNKIGEYFSILLFLQMLLSTVEICFQGFSFFNSSSLGMSAYKSRWYNVAPSDARCLLFIMLRSTRPLCLTAGKFGIFSMEMFSSILRTAMGYLSVLLTVSSGDN